MNTLSKDDLIKKVASDLATTQTSVSAMLDTLLNTIQETVATGGEIRINNFGIFSRVERAERMGINPKTQAPIKIEAHYAVRFAVGAGLKKAVKGS